MLEGFIGLTVFSMMIAASILMVRAVRQGAWTNDRHCFEVVFPHQSADRVEAFLASLTGLKLRRWLRPFGLPAVLVEVVADAQTIRHLISVPAYAGPYLLTQLRTAIPGARITRTDRERSLPDLAGELGLSMAGRMLRVDEPQAVASAILATLRPLAGAQRIIFQWVLAPASTPPPASETRPSSSRRVPGWTALLQAPDRTLSTSERREINAKHASPLFLVSARLGVSASSGPKQRGLLRRVTSVFHVADRPGVHLRRRFLPSSLAARRIASGYVPLLRFPIVLNTKEAAALIGFPPDGLHLPGLARAGMQPLPVPPGIPTDGPVIAKSNYEGSSARLTFGLRSLPTSAWVLGATGSGKSTLARKIAADYMRMGATVIVVDSKRDLAMDCVQDIPVGRERDLILFDPADDFPVGLNLLAGGDVAPDLVTDQLVGLFTKLWPGAVGARSQDILRASILTLCKSKQRLTIAELPRLLQDDAWAASIVGGLDDPVMLEPWWAAFLALSPAERANQIAAPLNKVRALLLRRHLLHVVGQTEGGLDFNRVVSEPTILLVSLSKGLIGDDGAGLLGAAILQRLFNALFARVALPAAERRPVLLVLDELQDYAFLPLSLGGALAQLRAMNAGVVSVHQHAHQIPADLRRDLQNNARTKVCFQLAADDAGLLAREYGSLVSAEDLQSLERYEVVASVCVDGRVMPPATGTTLGLPVPTGAGEQARALSRARYGRPRDQVEGEIRERHARRAERRDLGRRRRA